MAPYHIHFSTKQKNRWNDSVLHKTAKGTGAKDGRNPLVPLPQLARVVRPRSAHLSHQPQRRLKRTVLFICKDETKGWDGVAPWINGPVPTMHQVQVGAAEATTERGARSSTRSAGAAASNPTMDWCIGHCLVASVLSSIVVPRTEAVGIISEMTIAHWNLLGPSDQEKQRTCMEQRGKVGIPVQKKPERKTWETTDWIAKWAAVSAFWGFWPHLRFTPLPNCPSFSLTPFLCSIREQAPIPFLHNIGFPSEGRSRLELWLGFGAECDRTNLFPLPCSSLGVFLREVWLRGGSSRNHGAECVGGRQDVSFLSLLVHICLLLWPLWSSCFDHRFLSRYFVLHLSILSKSCSWSFGCFRYCRN
jgi:hypothetical protein